VLGDPTEAALIVVAEKAKLSLADLSTEQPRISEMPFDSVSKCMSTVHRMPDGKLMAYVKGAPGTIIAACNSQLHATDVEVLTEEDRQSWKDANEQLASAALRVLGMAYRELPEGYEEAALLNELTFVGLVGMSDPLREEAKAAIGTCREAGIRTVM
jgi:Ca2+-transporting ATPase